MYHSIIFGDDEKNTWADWYLIPSSRPVFNPPAPKTKFIDIPGADSHWDASRVLTGDMAYNNRTGSIEFIVDNDHIEWHALYSRIMDYLHGQVLKATLEDDPSYYYEGNFSVNSWKSEAHNSKIVIDYNVFPYKYEKASSRENWEWDSFNFETGVIREYNNLRVDGKRVFTIIGQRMQVIPSFIVKSDKGKGMDVTFNGKKYHLADGTTREIHIITKMGENKLTFTGYGTVSIEYRGGCL